MTRPAFEAPVEHVRGAQGVRILPGVEDVLDLDDRTHIVGVALEPLEDAAVLVTEQAGEGIAVAGREIGPCEGAAVAHLARHLDRGLFGRVDVSVAVSLLAGVTVDALHTALTVEIGWGRVHRIIAIFFDDPERARSTGLKDR